MSNLYLKLLEKEDRIALVNMYKKIHETFPENVYKKKEYDSWANLSDEEWNLYINCHRKREKGLDEKIGFEMHKYYLVKDGEFIGITDIKPNLKSMGDEWETYGGHVSYWIVPDKRNSGYGTEILHMVLEKCFEIGLKEVMITCREDNIGSSKIIESNFGILKRIIPYNGELNPSDIGFNYKIYNINVEKSLRNYVSTIDDFNHKK